MKQLRVLLLPLDGMLVYRRVAPSSMSPVPICTPWWSETMWGKDCCLWKQHDGRDWALNYRPSDLKSNMLTTTPLCPHNRVRGGGVSKALWYSGPHCKVLQHAMLLLILVCKIIALPVLLDHQTRPHLWFLPSQMITHHHLQQRICMLLAPKTNN